VDTAASVGWEKYYCLAAEHMLFTNLFLNNFIKMVNFLEIFTGWMRILEFTAFHFIAIKLHFNEYIYEALYGCETWSQTLREEHRLRVFENRVLRRIFEPRRDEVTGDWRKLHNVELHNLYSSPNIIRMIKSRRVRMGRACSTSGGDKECI
jgi:hypothetical protein